MSRKKSDSAPQPPGWVERKPERPCKCGHSIGMHEDHKVEMGECAVYWCTKCDKYEEAGR